LPLDVLAKVDRMTMAHSLEARPPLLDHKLVEFAARLPPEWQLRGGTTKAFFKRALRGMLPDATLERRKQGFAIPLGRWFGGELSSFARDLLLATDSRSREFFEPARVRHLVEGGAGRDDLGLDLWTLISVELWCRRFLGPSLPAASTAGLCARDVA
jgi:asparagine synthase (glutamine-hydrolysing)